MTSAGITFLDRDAVLREARALGRELHARHPEIERILLFGSFARGGGGPRSDLDLVIIVSETPLSPRDRLPHYAPASARPIDLFVYRRDEVEAMGADPAPVLREALNHGVEL